MRIIQFISPYEVCDTIASVEHWTIEESDYHLGDKVEIKMVRKLDEYVLKSIINGLITWLMKSFCSNVHSLIELRTYFTRISFIICYHSLLSSAFPNSIRHPLLVIQLFHQTIHSFNFLFFHIYNVLGNYSICSLTIILTLSRFMGQLDSKNKNNLFHCVDK